MDEEPWHKAYLQTEEPPQENTIMLTEDDEVAFAQEPRQAILIVGPNGPGRVERQPGVQEHFAAKPQMGTSHVNVREFPIYV